MAIKSFRNKSLEAFFLSGDTSGVNPKHSKKLETRLDRLDGATCPNDMRLPGYRLHKLEPKTAERYAVDVSGAWRLTFQFEGGDAEVVDYEQYH